MKKIDNLSQIKKIELDILRFMKNVCEENNLTYFLSVGTLLGAIRHKGFIPWDDDIDVSMPRKDYKKFIEIMKKDYQESDYEMITDFNNKEYYQPFGKLINKKTLVKQGNAKYDCGVWIDVFIIDGLGDSRKEANSTLRNIKFIKKIINMINKPEINNENFLIQKLILFCRFIIRLLGKKLPNKIMDQYASKRDFYSSKWIGSVVCGSYGNREIIEQENFMQSIDVEFEGELFKAPIGYHKYLSSLYGEYMKLPPKEQQVSHHSFEAWWIN